MEERKQGSIGLLISNAVLFSNGLIAHLHADTAASRNAGLGRMGSAALLSVGAGALAKYGQRSVPQQVTRLEEKLAAHLREQGVPLDAAHLRMADAETKRGWGKKIEDFIYTYPVETTNAYNALASGGFLISGLLRKSDGNLSAGNANLGFTALTMIGTLASILIPEKTPEQLKETGQDGTLWGEVQKKPLSSVRWLFLGADALAGMEALGEYKAASALAHANPYRNWQFGMAGLSTLALGAGLTGDWLTGAGSKKAGGAPDARDAATHAVLAQAAAIIGAQPLAAQQALIHHVARYLATQHELRLMDVKPEMLEKEMNALVLAHSAPTNQTTATAHAPRVAVPLLAAPAHAVARN